MVSARQYREEFVDMVLSVQFVSHHLGRQRKKIESLIRPGREIVIRKILKMKEALKYLKNTYGADIRTVCDGNVFDVMIIAGDVNNIAESIKIDLKNLFQRELVSEIRRGFKRRYLIYQYGTICISSIPAFRGNSGTFNTPDELGEMLNE